MNEATTETTTASPAASRRDLSIDIGRASIYGPLMLMPLVLGFALAFYLLWGSKAMSEGAATFFNLFSFLPAVIVGTLTHELIHALGWWQLGKTPWCSIKFGFMLSALAPYAHCKQPLEIGVYRWGALLPGLLLGVLPMLLSLWRGNGWLLIFGTLFTIAAGGDALVLWLIRQVKPGALIEDHLTRAGCYVLDSASTLAADA